MFPLGSASVVKGLFTYLDALVNNVMSEFFQDTMPINVPHIAPYPDFFSFGVVLLFASTDTDTLSNKINNLFVTVALAFGAKESTLVNNVFTLVNLIVVVAVIVSGLWKGIS